MVDVGYLLIEVFYVLRDGLVEGFYANAQKSGDWLDLSTAEMFSL